MQSISNYIAGELVPPASGRWLDNIDPATGRAYSLVPDSDSADIDRAIGAAQAAFPKWSATCAENRSHTLLRIAELIERDLDALALAECIDNGKPLARCRTVDIPRAVQNFRFFATAILH